MIRPFDLRDIRLVQKLASGGLILDSRLALTVNSRPFQDAMLYYLLASRGAPTLVLRRRLDGQTLRGFGQLRLVNPQPGQDCKCQARLVMLAADPPEQMGELWPWLLDGLTTEAGRRGAHALLAEVEDNSVQLEELRRAEFSVYARQEIWRLDRPPVAPAETFLRPAESVDRWQIVQLITNTVPLLIQQVEPLPPDADGLVWMQEGNLLAFLHVRAGARGLWSQLYLHPQAEERAEALIGQMAAHYRPDEQRPLYCCVRRHQQWLNRPLAALDFTLLGSQAVMVRHTTVRAAQPEYQPLPVRDKALEVTSPIVRSRTKHQANQR